MSRIGLAITETGTSFHIGDGTTICGRRVFDVVPCPPRVRLDELCQRCFDPLDRANLEAEGIEVMDA